MNSASEMAEATATIAQLQHVLSEKEARIACLHADLAEVQKHVPRLSEVCRDDL